MIDSFEEVALRRIAIELVEVIEDAAAPFGRSESLALVLAAAFGGDLCVGAAEERIVCADVEAE